MEKTIEVNGKFCIMKFATNKAIGLITNVL